MTQVPRSVRLLTGPGDLIIEPRRRTERRRIADLPPGASVVLTDDRPGARIRLRRDAARLGLQISKEYIVLPSWRRPSFVVEDHPTTLAWLWTTLATVPPGVSRGSLLMSVAVTAGRHRLVLAAVGGVAPGRVVIASRR